MKDNTTIKPGSSIEKFTGNRRKDYQERYDKFYEAFQKHFMYGNYFRINQHSHDRIHDLTLAALAFENMAIIKGAVKEGAFLDMKFKFASGNQGCITNLLNCYRPEIWVLFSELTGYDSEEF